MAVHWCVDLLCDLDFSLHTQHPSILRTNPSLYLTLSRVGYRADAPEYFFNLHAGCARVYVCVCVCVCVWGNGKRKERINMSTVGTYFPRALFGKWQKKGTHKYVDSGHIFSTGPFLKKRKEEKKRKVPPKKNEEREETEGKKRQQNRKMA